MERDVRINDLTNSRAGATPSQPAARQDTRSSIIRRQAQPNILIKLQDIFFLCLRNWKWYALSLLLCLGYARYQVKKSPNIYERSASIMIKGDERSANGIASLQQMGIETVPQDVNNELMAIRSLDVATQVVKRLDLDVDYYREGSLINRVAYGRDLPMKVKFLDLGDDQPISCVMELRPDSTVRVSNVIKQGEPFTGEFVMRLGQTAKTPIGMLELTPTPYYRPGSTDRLIVTHSDMPSAARGVTSRLNAFLRGGTTIIDLHYTDFSAQRAEDVLNTLVEVYNESWIHDKNKVTQLTNEFINSQIESLEKELNDVETLIANYKSDRLILDIAAEGTKALSVADIAEDRSFEIENQIYIIEYMRAFIENPDNANKLLPMNTGIKGGNIETQLSQYNALMQQRDGHLAHSSEQNPLVRDLDEKLQVLKQTIVQSIDNELLLLNNEKESVLSRKSAAEVKIAAAPHQSIYFKTIERQKAVKENIYLMLLQKRADNQLSQAFTAYNSRLIEPPHGSWMPISPQPGKAYLNALLIALLVPTAIIVLKESFNTVVRGRKDIEHLTVPFVGEIPLDANAEKRAKAIEKKKRRQRKKGRHIKEEDSDFVVVEKSRNVMNEAFRVVRSNLEFILGFDQRNRVIMVTSLNPSSGKTFITANLASSIGINNKKVIAIDVDMRKGTLSKYVGKPASGISNYLSGQLQDYHSLIVRKANIDIMPCGSLPPNPSELLYTDAFAKMIAELREEYDYVFLDCPPVEVVADSQIINRYADMTLFVIRAQLLDRAFLPDLEAWYQTKRYHNLATILNGTTDAFSRYGYHKYGYRYGYHYGDYGYGYGNEK